MAGTLVQYFSYRSARGDLMLEITVNGERLCLLGPFETKDQRQMVLRDLRSAVKATGSTEERRYH